MLGAVGLSLVLAATPVAASPGDVDVETGDPGVARASPTTPPAAPLRPAAATTAPPTTPGTLFGSDCDNLYTIDPATGAATLIGPHGASLLGGLAIAPDGTMYGLTYGSGAQLVTVDPNTGAASAIGPLGLFVFEGALALLPDGRLLGVDTNTSSNAETFEIDRTTGTATIISTAPQARDINGMTVVGGTIYTIDRPSDTLGTLDPATGQFSVIGTVSPAVIGSVGGLAGDTATGRLYATFSQDGGFYELDPATGAATFIAINGVDCALEMVPAPTLAVAWDEVDARHLPDGAAVAVTWSTFAEDGTVAFVIERAAARTGPFQVIGQPVPARGPGHRYQLVDADLPAGAAAPYYRVVEHTGLGRDGVSPVVQARSGGTTSGRQRR